MLVSAAFYDSLFVCLPPHAVEDVLMPHFGAWPRLHSEKTEERIEGAAQEIMISLLLCISTRYQKESIANMLCKCMLM